jgi:hypothetical protein
MNNVNIRLYENDNRVFALNSPDNRKYGVTAKARRIADRLAAEWRATEAAIADLETEIPYPLSRVVTDIEEALRRKSFHDRIADKLAADDAWRS